jgi:hypothetical protein
VKYFIFFLNLQLSVSFKFSNSIKDISSGDWFVNKNVLLCKRVLSQKDCLYGLKIYDDRQTIKDCALNYIFDFAFFNRLEKKSV